MTNSPWLRLLVLLAAVLPAFADQASKRTLIEEMLSLTKADSMIPAVIDQQRSALQQQMKQVIDSNSGLRSGGKDAEALLTEFQNKMFDILRKALDWTALKPQLVAIYDEVFSEEEVAGAVAFYKTPAGQALLNKMPDLMSRTMQWTQQLMQSVMPDLQRLNKELEEKAAKIAADKAK
jgi:uncharacterized protein